MLQNKLSSNLKSKILLVVAVMFMLGLASSTVAAAQSDVAQVVVAHDHESDLFSSSEPPKWQLMHFDRWGNPTGHLHGLTIDEYYAVLDAVLASGGDPSPRNMDRMYDHMFGRGG